MKAVCLLSGGIDSPVAAQIAIKNGFQPLLLHYHNYPFHSPGTLEKVVAIANEIASRNLSTPLSLSIMTHGGTQEQILNGLEGREIQQTCLFCRIQMFYKAQIFANLRGAETIITGEIMGEQASQTLENLPMVTSKIKILALRPLIGYNKQEVISLSKKWGYYDLSIQPGGCCSINPQYPETRGRSEVIDPIYDRIGVLLKSISRSESDSIVEFQLPVKLKEVLEVVET
ncbi:MAG: 7-cyano-7-deazaguanine synthase [Candidatus Hodarchaeales archaeon]|jgi:thiamine biosynthesis protein ThiI